MYLLGYPNQAQRRAEEALAGVRTLQDPYTPDCGLLFRQPLLSDCT